jgi:putative nucleotidyltransferase with HDIG domain
MLGRLGTCTLPSVTTLEDDARQIAEQHLAGELPRRWRHVQAVAVKAERVALVLDDTDRSVLVAAAWLHDIGYVQGLDTTGFHPLDGARWLREQNFDARATALVAHHSCALVEADERGLSDELAAEFSREESPTADALWYCDMTTGPDGQDYDVVERLDEIRSRYGPGHVVTRFVDRAQPAIVAAVRRTEDRIARVVDRQPM